ncbi:MAG TPA: bifunctional oligoribonuclease/PAP phosphatase NrnA [Holophagaceae bacterium]|nr:bifunctional oligoribonuclease/PAP phosphatase NrnA [Holophagaceae bacterium]
MLDRFAAFLDQHQRFLLTTHENPDGDGVGASLGLAAYLRSQGKEVRLVVTPELPENLHWLDEAGLAEAYEPEGRHRDLAAWPDVWLVTDASEPHRLGPMHAAFQSTPAVKACLDHHLKDAPKGFDAEFTDPSASASAELVYGLVAPRLERPWPLELVRGLYAGMVADTGNFRFSNATPKLHQAAADLIAQGAEPARTYQNLYLTDTPQKMKLWGRALEGLRLLEQGRVALVTVTLADLAACGATHEDLDELVQQPMRLKGVEVGGLLYEAADGRIKLSLRSKERVDVNAVCRTFGGGGHRLASGAKLDGPLAEAAQRVEAALAAQIARDLG